jgi:Haem-NO-binding
MKGTILQCMEELVISRFDPTTWTQSLKKAGLSEHRMFSTMEDVDDAQTVVLMHAISESTSLTMDAFMEAFGTYWSTVYAPRVYKPYFDRAKTAREFLLSLDEIHTAMTKSMRAARPPHFRYEWKGDKHLIMHYQSHRGLVALMPGLVRGLGKYYKEKLNVRTVGESVHIVFE